MDRFQSTRRKLLFLKDTLIKSIKGCIVVLHKNLDPTIQKDHIIKNAYQIREIIEQSNKVPLVLQGYYHIGADSVVNGIRYIIVPAMCEGFDNHFLILELDKNNIRIYGNRKD